MNRRGVLARSLRRPKNDPRYRYQFRQSDGPYAARARAAMAARNDHGIGAQVVVAAGLALVLVASSVPFLVAPYVPPVARALMPVPVPPPVRRWTQRLAAAVHASITASPVLSWAVHVWTIILCLGGVALCLPGEPPVVIAVRAGQMTTGYPAIDTSSCALMAFCIAALFASVFVMCLFACLDCAVYAADHCLHPEAARFADRELRDHRAYAWWYSMLTWT